MAQTADAPVRLAPGLTWWRVRDARGPWNSYVVRIDLRAANLSLMAVHAKDSLTGRERPSSIAQRYTDSTTRVRVAVNADFFELGSGASENNQVTNGEWWKGLMLTESPYDTYDNVHAQVAVTRDGRAAVERYVLDGRAVVRGTPVPVLSVNALPTGPYEGTALYTARFGATTPRGFASKDTARRASELALRAIDARGDTLRYVVVEAAVPRSGSAIPANGAVLAAYGDRVPSWQRAQPGDTVPVLLTTRPRLPDGRSPALLLGGWPRLLEQGVNVAREAAIREGTISRNAEARHPRTAVGVSRDRRTMWLYVVDGRSTTSVGMTTTELADALRALGAWDALNFDGGGSTTLVVDGQVINAPSDATGERAVGNMLLVRETTRRR